MNRKNIALFLGVLLFLASIFIFNTQPVAAEIESTITGTIYSFYAEDSNFQTARKAAQATGTFISALDTGAIGILKDNNKYLIYRTLLYFDTSNLPSNIEITSAEILLYPGTRISGTDGIVASFPTSTDHPSSPPELDDYYMGYYSSSCGWAFYSENNRRTLSLSLYSSGRQKIRPGGTTIFYLRTSEDMYNSYTNSAKIALFSLSKAELKIKYTIPHLLEPSLYITQPGSGSTISTSYPFFEWYINKSSTQTLIEIENALTIFDDQGNKILERYMTPNIQGDYRSYQLREQLVKGKTYTAKISVLAKVDGEDKVLQGQTTFTISELSEPPTPEINIEVLGHSKNDWGYIGPITIYVSVINGTLDSIAWTLRDINNNIIKTGSSTSNVFTLSDPGEYQLTITAKNSLDNNKRYIKTEKINVDINKPLVDINESSYEEKETIMVGDKQVSYHYIYKSDSSIYVPQKDNVQLYILASDDATPPENLYISMDLFYSGLSTPINIILPYSHPDLPVSADFSRVPSTQPRCWFRLVAKDLADQITHSSYIRVDIDKTPPREAFYIYQKPVSGPDNYHTVLRVNAVDDQAGINTILISKDNGVTWYKISAGQAVPGTEFSFGNLFNQGNSEFDGEIEFINIGTFVIKYKLFDMVGNVKEGEIIVVSVHSPELVKIKISPPPTNDYYYNQSPLTVTLEYDPVKVRTPILWQVDSEIEWNEYKQPFYVSGEGSHKIVVQYYNTADELFRPIKTVFIDTQPPEVSLSFQGKKDTRGVYTDINIMVDYSDTGSGIYSAEYQIGSQAKRALSSSGMISTTSIPDGQHTISVEVTDRALNKTTKENTFIKDTAPPQLIYRIEKSDGQQVLLLLNRIPWSTLPVYILIDAMDEGAPSNLFSISAIKVNETELSKLTTPYIGSDGNAYNYVLVLDKAGIYTLKITAIDLAGHQAENMFTLGVDDTPPEDFSIITSGNYAPNTLHSVIWSPSRDNESEISKYIIMIYKDNELAVSENLSNTTTVYYYEFAQGSYIVKVIAVNGAGLTTEKTATIEVGLVNYSVTLAPLKPWFAPSEPPKVRITYENLTKYSYSLSASDLGTNVWNLTETSGEIICTIENAVLSSNLTVYFKFWDIYNQSSTRTVTISYDLNAPTISNLPSKIYTKQKDISISNVTIVDTEGGELTIEYMVDNMGQWIPIYGYNPITNKVLNISLLSDEEVARIIQLKVSDNRGNVTISLITAVVDNTPPTITISSLPESTTLEEIIVSGTVYDLNELAYVKVYHNGTEIYHSTDFDLEISLTLSSGSNTIQIVAEDMAGNSSEYVYTIEKVVSPMDLSVMGIVCGIVVFMVIVFLKRQKVKNLIQKAIVKIRKPERKKKEKEIEEKEPEIIEEKLPKEEEGPQEEPTKKDLFKDFV